MNGARAVRHMVPPCIWQVEIGGSLSRDSEQAVTDLLVLETNVTHDVETVGDFRKQRGRRYSTVGFRSEGNRNKRRDRERG